MLLRNESRIKHSIEIKLIFDDNKTRELEINEFDYVQVSYRKNGCIKCGLGIIRNIKPYIHTKKWSFCKKESAIITLDMSESNVSCIDKIDLYDIIDIRKVQLEENNCECDCNLDQDNSDFTITKQACVCECSTDNEEVTSDD